MLNSSQKSAQATVWKWVACDKRDLFVICINMGKWFDSASVPVHNAYPLTSFVKWQGAKEENSVVDQPIILWNIPRKRDSILLSQNPSFLY